MKNVAVLGATGSIGGNTLDVIARHPDRFRASVLTAHRQVEALVRCACAPAGSGGDRRSRRWKPNCRVELAAAGVRCEVASGHAALTAAASGELCDTVVAAIVGAAGLDSTLAAARAGKRLLLANKEAIVMAGPLLLEAVLPAAAR
jgi:1-deoxy-D-xylulose-5-phosphate reductoisomerase